MAEINPGVWDGLTPELVKNFYPDEWERFVRDPYAYRAPRAESYHDLCGKWSLLPVLRSYPHVLQFVWSPLSLSLRGRRKIS